MTLLDLLQQDAAVTIRNGEAWCCCPFHQEHTPSFSVNIEKDVFHCFGCLASGDAISYLRRKRGLSFRDAARLVGKELPAYESEHAARERAVKDRLLRAYFLWYHRTLAETCDLFHELTAEADVAGIAYRATHRCPARYTQDEQEYWALYLSELYDLLPIVEHQLDVLTYDALIKERMQWWEEE
jgi:hypothetical protein